MTFFEPKIVTWYKSLIDTATKVDVRELKAILDHQEFGSCVDRKTGLLKTTAYLQILVAMGKKEDKKYNRYDIGSLMAENCSAYNRQLLFDLFPEAEEEAKSSWLRSYLADKYFREAEDVKLFISKGANPNIPGDDGRTALHIAAQFYNFEVIHALLELGANPCLKDKRMETPADVAQNSKNIGLAFYLREEMKKYEAVQTAKNANTEWQLLGPHEVAFVEAKPQIGYKITSLFNFASGLCTQIARNTVTQQESQTVFPLESLKASGLFDQALVYLHDQGGFLPHQEACVKKPPQKLTLKV